MENKKLEINPTPFVCELGHKVLQYYVPGRAGTRMLCPQCDREHIDKLLDDWNKPKEQL